MSIFKCKMCGGTIEFEPGATVGVCDSCGTKQTLPRLDDDRRANLYDRANHFRRNNEFDKAMAIYEQILNEDGTDAEAYWSLVLCRYGIEYVEDPATHKRVPTVNRAQFTSIFDDEDYKSALQYADGYQRSIYEEEAAAINEIQKGILAISQKEKPFDVFICYKETDANGRRTQDSVLANDLYHQLTQEGFKVFFSRITLEDKLGTAYEPYIFAALNSAKVMVVIGTKPEHFNAVWVKNEWSRYLALIKNGAKKVLIPAYRDMDPYDLPEEFSHLQAQDMSKLGFMQDLIRGIKKLAEADAPKTVVKETVVTGGGDAAPLLKRAFMFLEDGNWNSANEYCEKVLDMDPESAEAYLGKLMAELHCFNINGLKNLAQPFDDLDNYEKAIRFADADLKQTLQDCISYINDRNENARLEGIYLEAAGLSDGDGHSEQDYLSAAEKFQSISGYKDADTKVEECKQKAETARKNKILIDAVGLQKSDTISNLEKASALFKSIPGWEDADQRDYDCQKRIGELKKQAEQSGKRNKKIAAIVAAMATVAAVIALIVVKIVIPTKNYNEAIALRDSGDYSGAIIAFAELGNFKDSEGQILLTYYAEGESLLAKEDFGGAITAFSSAMNYKDSPEKVLNAYYLLGKTLLSDQKYDQAITAFNNAANYGDASILKDQCYYEYGLKLFQINSDYAQALVMFNRIKDVPQYPNLEKLKSLCSIVNVIADITELESQDAINRFIEKIEQFAQIADELAVTAKLPSNCSALKTNIRYYESNVGTYSGRGYSGSFTGKAKITNRGLEFEYDSDIVFSGGGKVWQNYYRKFEIADNDTIISYGYGNYSTLPRYNFTKKQDD